jgi:hypothetical protein
MKGHKYELYRQDNPKNFTEDEEKKSKFDAQCFEDGYFELLIWAVFSNKLNLLKYFWTKCNNPLLGAIVSG